MPLIDRFTLLAIQFDLTFQISPNGRTLKLVPAPDDVFDHPRIPGGPAGRGARRKVGEPLAREPHSRFGR